MPQFRASCEPGEVIEIRLADGRPCSCVVLFASREYKDVILLGVPRLGEGASEFPGEAVSLGELGAVIYTSSAPIRGERWKRAGRVDLFSQYELLSLRTIASTVWMADIRGRKLSRQEAGNLGQVVPEMDCAGETLVEEVLSELRSGTPESRYTAKVMKSGKSLLGKFDRLDGIWRSNSEPAG